MRALLGFILALTLTGVGASPASGGDLEPADRQGIQWQVGLPPVPPPPPSPRPGDCDGWRHQFVIQGASPVAVSFFFDQGIIWRETRCGLDTLNEATGDSGICQINPVHNRAGYFGGIPWGDGGWLWHLHGLRTRQATDSPAWVAACITLHEVCDTRPWQRPYGCANRKL